MRVLRLFSTHSPRLLQPLFAPVVEPLTKLQKKELRKQKLVAEGGFAPLLSPQIREAVTIVACHPFVPINSPNLEGF
jgi:hypothetical protein